MIFLNLWVWGNGMKGEARLMRDTVSSMGKDYNVAITIQRVESELAGNAIKIVFPDFGTAPARRGLYYVLTHLMI